MSSEIEFYVIRIERYLYSYGFELKDEVRPYKEYAIVSKITNNVASDEGLKVGDKIISINGEKVAGKNYISLKNIIRKSLNNCVRLEILNDKNSPIISPDSFSHEQKLTSVQIIFEQTLIPRNSVSEKYENWPDYDGSTKRISELSDRCYHINKYADNYDASSINRADTNCRQVASVSETRLMQDDDVSSESDVIRTISQEPFIDDSIRLTEDILSIELPTSWTGARDSKSSDYLEAQLSLNSHDTVFEHCAEPFDDKPIVSPVIPKLEMPGFPSSYSISSGFTKLSPEFIATKSHSSNNIFQDITLGWSDKELNNKTVVEFGSMTNVNFSNKMNLFNNKKFSRRTSTIMNIPIKLRIIQFHDKVKSKGWKDYIIEPEPNGARFRKRHQESQKNDRTNNFIIRTDDINKFDIDSPHRRHRTASSNDVSSQESLLKYSLMAFNNRVQIKFHFNSTIFQDDVSSNRACTMFKEIINAFKAFENKSRHSTNFLSLSQSSNLDLSLSESPRNFPTAKESHSSIDELATVESHNSATNSYKSTSKSSVENIPIATLDTGQSSTKNIFKQAMGKIKPEKKIKVTQTYQVFTGTKAEFEEFQKQLEGGHLPLELDSSDEQGMNFDRYIYEVPRMNINPKIPMIIYLCTEIVEKIGLKVEGIYRISGNQRVIRTLSTTLNKTLDEIEINLPEWNNVHAVCGTLKLFLRKLKQYLIPADLSHVLAYSCKAADIDDHISLSKTLLDIRYHLSQYQIPSQRRSDSNMLDQADCRWQSLQYILRHLSKVIASRDYNSMDEHALSICFNPVLMESWQHNLHDIKADNEIMVKALELILVHQNWLFSNWNADINNRSWSSELVGSAQKYAAEFIDRKYDYCSRSDVDDGFVEDKDIDVNMMVQEIVLQATTKFGEKRKLERRHSSHTPGQRSVILLQDEVHIPSNCDLRRNSQTAEALDLFSCASWMRQLATVPTIEENKEITVTYIPCTEPDGDIYEPCVDDVSVIGRQQSLGRHSDRRRRRVVDYVDHSKDIVLHSSQTSLHSQTLG